MEELCLLCLEVQQTNDEFWDGIKADSRTWNELNIQAVLEKHFWPLNDILIPSSWICLKCWQNVRDFHKFYMRVEESQILAGKLRTIKTDLQSYEYLEPEVIKNQPQSLQDIVIIKTESPFKGSLKNSNQSTAEKENKANYLTDDERWQENEPEDANSSSDCEINSSNQNGDTSNATTTVKRPSAKNYKNNDLFIMAHFTEIICDLCGVELKGYDDMQKHFINVHKEIGYLVCCNRKFYHRNRLVDHIHTHLNPEHFKCDQCGKILSDRRNLKSHMLSRHQPSEVQLNYSCDVCSETFSKANVLRRHKLTHVPEEEKRFPCSVCGKLFASLYVLKLHEDVLHVIKFEKVCCICGLTLRTSTDYKAHMTKHEPLALICDICGSRLSTERCLKLHKESQHPVGGKESHKCSECSKVSPTLRALKKHISNMHRTGCEYKCSFCEKAFRKPEALKKHIASHTDTVIHSCPWCPKIFKSNSNMYAHSKKMHPKEREERVKKYTRTVPQYLK